MKLNSILLLIGLIIFVISKEPQKTQKIKTEIEIVTTKHSKEIPQKKKNKKFRQLETSMPILKMVQKKIIKD